MSRKKCRRLPLVSALATGLFLLNTSISMAEIPELSLDDSIAMALKNNPSIQMAIADKEKAAWGIKENEAGKLPTLSLMSGYNRSPGSSSPTDSFNNSLKLNWSLYTGGRVEGQINQAKLNADVASLGVTKAQEQLKLDTTTAYYNVLQGHNVVKVNQETVDNLTQHLKNVKAQYQVGTIAKSDLLRSEVELANAEQNLTKAQNNYDVAVASFNNMTGMPMDSQNIMKDDLTYVKYDMSLEDSIKMAQEKRPEIAQSKDNLAIATTGIKIADSGRLPTVAVSANDGLSGSDFPGQNNNWSIGVSASWNIFDAGVTNSKVKEAKANEDKVKAGDQQIRQGIELEVRQAYLSMKEAEARIETSKVAVSKAAEDLKASQAKYYAGVGTNIDVIDAQMALTQANTNATQASYDYNVNKAKLEKAAGLGVK
ncbi:TolC family protein [Pelosinus sp. sgz500959]|uniref:TolC family protein n=1 Tax=Pelosinus sp. sgz500959 TaxID=3242472 RepID=UPI00367084F3